MTKLEPTRTSSDLTATERVRELLDERGVEWMDDSYAQLWCTVWDGQDGKQWRMTENQSGMLTELKAWKATPEQAIAATLGSCNCTNDERTDVPHLPHFWTHDGTLHVELPKLPESISVRMTDQRDREAGSARTWQYTRGSGTCEIHDCEGSFSAVNRPVWRCDCGAFMTQFTDATTYHKPRFCPNCGRKVVDE